MAATTALVFLQGLFGLRLAALLVSFSIGFSADATALQTLATTQVYTAWTNEMALPTTNATSIKGKLVKSLSNNNPFGLYDLQFDTYYQLVWLQYAPDSIERSAMLDAMVQLYSIPLAYRTSGVDENGIAMTGWICRAAAVPAIPGAKKCDTTLNKESFLYSVQYLYGVTKLMHDIAQAPEANRTSAQTTFIETFAPIVVSHFDRWLAGCETGKVLYSQFRAATCAAANKPSGMTDEWMQFTGAIAELYRAAETLPSLQDALAAKPATGPDYRAFLATRAFGELKARTKEFPSAQAGLTRAVFDASWTVGYGVDANGTVRGINRCAYNTTTTLPQLIGECPTKLPGDTAARKTTLDISHYIRVVFMLESLAQDTDATISTWALAAIPKFARQFTEQVVVSELTAWTLANFFGDSKGAAPAGWARVFFDKTGKVLPYCNTLPAASRQSWINCAPYDNQSPGEYSNRPGYFMWAPYAPGLRDMGQNYFLSYAPLTSSMLAIREVNALGE